MSSCCSCSLLMVVGLLLSHQVGPKLVASTLGDLIAVASKLLWPRPELSQGLYIQLSSRPSAWLTSSRNGAQLSPSFFCLVHLARQGYAFITFDEEDSATASLTMTGTTFRDQRLTVELSQWHDNSAIPVTGAKREIYFPRPFGARGGWSQFFCSFYLD